KFTFRPGLLKLYFFHPLRYVDLPAETGMYGSLQLRRRSGLAVNKIGIARRFFESAQPGQQFGSISVIAELLQGGHLRANGHFVAENLDRWGAALDDETTRARRLKTDKQHKVLRIRQALRQVMQHASAGGHAAR